MKKSLLLYCSIILLFYCSSLTLAQEATSTAADGEKTKLTPTLDPIRKAVQEKIKSYVTGRPTAFVGILKNLANQALTVETKNGTKLASTSAETTIVRIIKKTKKEIAFADLELKETVIALGYLAENGALEVKRLIATEITRPPEREIILGNVAGIKKSVFTIKNSKKQETYEIKIDTKTKISMKNDGKIEEIGSEEIGIDSRIIAICKPAEDGKPPTALRLHLLRP